MRLPAAEIEQLVWDRLCRFLADQAGLLAALRTVVPDGHQQQALLHRTTTLRQLWPEASSQERRQALAGMITTIVVRPDRIAPQLQPELIAAALGASISAPQAARSPRQNPDTVGGKAKCRTKTI